MIDFLKDLAHLVDPRWHEEFLKFVDSGDASDEFLDYLEDSEDCRKAMDMVFESQAQALAGMVKEIKNV